MDIVSTIAQAGTIVQVVVLILVLQSINSWSIFFSHIWRKKKEAREDSSFLQGFWGGWTLEKSLQESIYFPRSPVAKAFALSMGEIADQESQEKRKEHFDRCVEKSLLEQTGGTQRQLTSLASTASTAPFIGLFGTVWGIMKSMASVGQAKQAHFLALAPGISEALFATALGLGAAIPASFFYNRLLRETKRKEQKLYLFSKELEGVLSKRGIL